MSRMTYQQNPMEETFNPFETREFDSYLFESLNEIDDRNIRRKFKNTKDPINLAFETLDNAPLKLLARDFVKDSFADIVSFVTNICK